MKDYQQSASALAPLRHAEPELSLAELQVYVGKAPLRARRSIALPVAIMTLVILTPVFWHFVHRQNSQPMNTTPKSFAVHAPTITETYSAAQTRFPKARIRFTRTHKSQRRAADAASPREIALELLRAGRAAYLADSREIVTEPPALRAGLEMQ